MVPAISKENIFHKRCPVPFGNINDLNAGVPIIASFCCEEMTTPEDYLKQKASQISNWQGFSYLPKRVNFLSNPLTNRKTSKAQELTQFIL